MKINPKMFEIEDPKNKGYSHLEIDYYGGLAGRGHNALVTRPNQGQKLCEDAIKNYLGDDALSRFAEKRVAVQEEMENMREKTGLRESVEKALHLIKEEEEKDE